MQLNLKSLSLLLLVAVSGSNAGTLRQRQSRDVSHLPLEYLPPVVLPPLPSREYLPPVEQHAASLPHVLQPPRDYLPPVEEQQEQQLKLSNEYLPPAPLEQQTEPAATEESTTTEETTTTTEAAAPLPTTTLAPEEEEAVPEVVPESETEAPVDVKTHENIEEASGILEEDGYHYRTPQLIPDLLPVPAPSAVEAYLPPIDDNAVVAVVPESEDETAALLDDGYHYRAIRRLRF